jgi:diguanylate cyclase (GGDEF)-like protein/PAS domain S-box-containing protein
MTAEPKPLRLLLVEDDEDDEILVLRALRRAGWDVSCTRVTDAPGVQAALSERFDAVISDHGLPGFDSLSALRLVREHDPDVPFIIVSGQIGEEAAADAMAAGASDYVMKGSLARLSPALDRELAEAAANERRREADAKAAQLAAIVESSFDAIMAVDPQRRLTCWNPGARRMYGWSAEHMLGRDLVEVLPPGRRSELVGLIDAALRGERFAEIETTRVTRGGDPVEVALAVTPIRNAAGDVVAVSLVERDIAERKRLLAQLEHLASHDALTGLLNRRGLEHELNGAIARANRYGEPVALLIVDLDNFKDTNDTLGHSAGDALICDVAERLSRRARATDVVARLGGDEFAIVLPRADAEMAALAAEQFRGAVADATARARATTASVGVAVHEPGLTVDDLLVRADLAMYSAKADGRDAVRCASPAEQTRLTALVSTEARIRAALCDGAFRMMLQPIVPLRPGLGLQGELLLRMLDGDRLMSPAEFLDVADRRGLMVDIDRWVIGEALSLMADGEALGTTGHVAINLSGHSVNDPGLVTFVESEVVRLGVDPATLVFEITETTAIANIARAASLAARLRGLGCRVALDDFGAGFGSFSYLKHLPLDYLKIDGQFIADLRTSRTDQVLVQGMVSVAHGLGLDTIAECVEDPETLELLRGYGVDFAQGFHTGRPQPVGRGVAMAGPGSYTSP